MITANNIRTLLAHRNMTQRALARETGMNVPTLNHKMTGRAVFRLNELDLIADVLGVTVSLLTSEVIAIGGDRPRIVHIGADDVARVVTGGYPTRRAEDVA